MRGFVILVSGFCLFVGNSALDDSELKLPSNLELCDLSKPSTERNECVKAAMEKFLTSKHDNTENFEYPQFDPFFYERATFNYRNSDILGGTFTVKNIKMYGFSRSQVKRVKTFFNSTSMQILAELNIPKMFQTGQYKSNFTLNAFKLQSHGQYNLTMKDVAMKWLIKGSTEIINDQQIMKINRFDAIPEPADLKFSVTGLFPDQELNNLVVQVMNENWKLFYSEMKEETRRQLNPILLQFANNFFAQIPWTYFTKNL